MKLSIIGAGKVGMTIAFNVIMKGLARELVLVARDRERIAGEAMDLDHAQAFLPAQAEIHAGGTADTAGSDVLVICASTTMEPGLESRNELGPANTRLFETLLPPLLKASPDALFLIVSNPVDILTWQALRITKLPPSRVFGTGTLLDSARFRRALSHELSIHPDDLRAYILGEHGDSQFPAMSMAMAGAERILETPERHVIFRETVSAGIEIFRRKGHTNYGIAAATTSILESIVLDEKRTMPLSVRIDGFCGVHDVCLSVPVVVGENGIDRVLHPTLDAEEIAEFRRSAELVRKAIAAC